MYYVNFATVLIDPAFKSVSAKDSKNVSFRWE